MLWIVLHYCLCSPKNAKLLCSKIIDARTNENNTWGVYHNEEHKFFKNTEQSVTFCDHLWNPMLYRRSFIVITWKRILLVSKLHVFNFLLFSLSFSFRFFLFSSRDLVFAQYLKKLWLYETAWFKLIRRGVLSCTYANGDTFLKTDTTFPIVSLKYIEIIWKVIFPLLFWLLAALRKSDYLFSSVLIWYWSLQGEIFPRSPLIGRSNRSASSGDPLAGWPAGMKKPSAPPR